MTIFIVAHQKTFRSSNEVDLPPGFEDYQQRYIEFYSSFIRTGRFQNFEPWRITKNWVELDISTGFTAQTHWNDDINHLIRQNCGFLDNLDSEIGIYLKK